MRGYLCGLCLPVEHTCFTDTASTKILSDVSANCDGDSKTSLRQRYYELDLASCVGHDAIDCGIACIRSYWDGGVFCPWSPRRTPSLRLDPTQCLSSRGGAYVLQEEQESVGTNTREILAPLLNFNTHESVVKHIPRIRLYFILKLLALFCYLRSSSRRSSLALLLYFSSSQMDERFNRVCSWE